MDCGAPKKFVSAAIVAAFLGGCGSEPSASQSGQGGTGGVGAGSGAGAGAGGAGGLFPSGSGAGPAGGGGTGTGTNTDTSCAGVTEKADLVPLDMYLMLDRSGSMSDETGPLGTGPTKWAAVTDALEAFFDASGPKGIGVGLQFFPATVPGMPETCTGHAECGAAGPCLLSSCDGVDYVLPCVHTADCGGEGICAQLGVCSGDPAQSCYYDHPIFGSDCGFDQAGNHLGTCEALVSSVCANPVSCSAADYATPAVEIAPLSAGATALMGAIAANGPGGLTPTFPAVGGLIGHAKEWAISHPTRRVVAVLATDGMPTLCDTQDIASIAELAADGASGTPMIETFVIGVFGQNDAGAQENLDLIAQQGGTGSAFFITDDQDVAQAFLAALDAIQGQSLACEYLIPAAPPGEELAYDQVNVEHTPDGQSAPDTIPYVGSAAGCDAAEGGWYYDKDPKGPEAPTKIAVCPATCAKLQGGGGEVKIRIGCETIVPEPK